MIVTGIEVSLWAAQQFCIDLQVSHHQMLLVMLVGHLRRVLASTMHMYIIYSNIRISCLQTLLINMTRLVGTCHRAQCQISMISFIKSDQSCGYDVDESMCIVHMVVHRYEICICDEAESLTYQHPRHQHSLL